MKIGADNPDNVYLSAPVRGTCDYRLTGTRGSIAYVSFGSKANRYAKDGTMASTGELRNDDLQVGADGSVEILVSATPKPGNWLPLAEDSTMLVIRQSYLDRRTEQPGGYRIERLGEPVPPPGPLSTAHVARSLQRTAMAVLGTAATFAQWTELFMTRPNELPDWGQEMYQRAGGDPEIYYLHGYWTLEPDQAWVITTDVPDCPYWNFQLDNWWMESMDYRHHKITVNKHTATLDDDGRLTLVVAAEDRGRRQLDRHHRTHERHRAAALGGRAAASAAHLPGRAAEGARMTTTTEALTVGDLLTAANDKAGSDDFGDRWFLEPLEVLVAALNDEAQLSPLGLDLTRRRLTALLVDRLRLRRLQREHPEILEVDVRVAAEICGLPRTGSTLLHRLLAASPQLTSTASWETSYPLPFPGEGSDAAERKQRARRKMEMFLELSPDFGDIHTVTWDEPEEDIILLDRTFVSQTFDSFYWVPSYGHWLRAFDQAPAYAELREWLQVLQWQDPSRAGLHWVLKSPHHLTATDTVLDTFPGCRIVMTHRSPVSAVPSYASMVMAMTSQYSDAVDPVAIGRYWRDRFVESLRGFAKVRAERPERFVDVQFTDTLSQPLAEAQRVLGELGLSCGPEDVAAFERYLARNREERHGTGAHRYTAEDFGLSQSQLERDFSFYLEEYL